MAKYAGFAIFLLTLLGGCSGLPEAHHPLSPPGAEPYDQRILGSWFAGEPDEDKFYIYLKARSDPNMLDGTGIIIEIGDDDFNTSEAAEIVWSAAIVHPSRLNGSTYYNISRLTGIGNDYGAAEDKKGYIIVKADLTDDQTLRLCVMDTSIVENAVKEGDIRGAFVEENETKNIKLDYIFMEVSERELINFIREDKTGGLFDACMLFQKLAA